MVTRSCVLIVSLCTCGSQGAAVGDAWNNHFSAFGAQDVDRVLLDYTHKSVITVYNHVTGAKTVFKGLDGVTDCFTGLFRSLFNTSDLAAPVQVVEEASKDGPGSVFLIWSAGKSGYADATDTFLFDADGKILRQNVVITYKDPKAEGEPKMVNDKEAANGTGPVHDSWNNHFAAFGAQDVDKVLKDYTNKSIITVYNQVDGTKTVFTGLDGVKDCFIGLFKSLPDTRDLAAPIIHVEEDPGIVFLVWSAVASGYMYATDTFIFDQDAKIFRQNVVVHYRKPSDTVVGAVPYKGETETSTTFTSSVSMVLTACFALSMLMVFNPW